MFKFCEIEAKSARESPFSKEKAASEGFETWKEWFFAEHVNLGKSHEKRKTTTKRTFLK